MWDICTLEIIMLAIAMAGDGGDGPGGGHPYCDLLVNISAESMNQTNDIHGLFFNKSDSVALRSELINNLDEDYYWIRVKYNISDLYIFPAKSVIATSNNTSSLYKSFTISFYRTNISIHDYFEINKAGILDLYCEDFGPHEKIYFNFSTQISNRPSVGDEYEITGLRKDSIDFKANEITRDDTGININKLNTIFIIAANHELTTVPKSDNGNGKGSKEDLTHFLTIITIFIIIILIIYRFDLNLPVSLNGNKGLVSSFLAICTITLILILCNLIDILSGFIFSVIASIITLPICKWLENKK